MNRPVLFAAALAACAGREPTTEPPPTPLPTCAAQTPAGGVACEAIDRCDDSPENLSPRLDCCACDAAYCEAPPLDVCLSPPPFPSDDTGPAVAFDRPVQAWLGGGGVEVLLTLTPAGVLVAEVPAGWVDARCMRSNNTLSCDPADAVPREGGWLHVHEVEVRLVDGDGDGAADQGWMRFGGLASSSEPLQMPDDLVGVFPLQLDEAPGALTLPADVPPTRALVVHASELARDVGPLTVRAGDAEARLDPAPVPGGAVATWADSGGSPVLPWGAALELTPIPTDLSGNTLVVSAGSVAPDPGPWTGNGGFEDGLTGWFAAGFSPAADISWPELVPPDVGAGMAVAPSGGTLVGHAVVPDGAQRLVFRYAAVGPSRASARLELVTPSGARATAWELRAEEYGPCAGSGVADGCVPWTTASVDVSASAGGGLYLDWDVRPGSVLWTMPSTPPLIQFAIDDVHFE